MCNMYYAIKLCIKHLSGAEVPDHHARRPSPPPRGAARAALRAPLLTVLYVLYYSIRTILYTLCIYIYILHIIMCIIHLCYINICLVFVTLYVLKCSILCCSILHVLCLYHSIVVDMLRCSCIMLQHLT